LILGVILFFPGFLSGETINDCAQLRGDQKNYCIAVAQLDVVYCERIINWSLRQECHLRVVRQSRERR
jgi:hypothetical protein